MLIQVAMQSKAQVCSRLTAKMASLNPAEGMAVYRLCLLCVVRW